MPSKDTEHGGRPYISDVIYLFFQSFGLQHMVAAACHPQRKWEAQKGNLNNQECLRKLQVTSKQGKGKVLQMAASAYQMVPHKATGFSPIF